MVTTASGSSFIVCDGFHNGADDDDGDGNDGNDGVRTEYLRNEYL